MNNLNKGFTLIELMIVVAIIGILSMFALPAYQDYIKRTYVAEGIQLTGGIKAEVISYFAVHGTFPDSVTELGYDPTIISHPSIGSREFELIPMSSPLRSVEIGKLPAGENYGERYLLILHYDDSVADSDKYNDLNISYFAKPDTGSIEAICHYPKNMDNALPKKYLPSICQQNSPK